MAGENQGTSVAGSAGSALLGSVPVLGSIAQGVINSVQQRRNIDRQNRANRELANYQYSKDLDMWNKGNAYNAPQAQMERLRAAGLNPNLVYGSGTVAGQAAQQLPKYNAPQMDYNYQPPVDLPGTLGAYQDYRIQQAQLDNMKAQRTAIVQEGLKKQIENEANMKYTTVKDSQGTEREGTFKEMQNIIKLQGLVQGQDIKTQMFPYQFDAAKLRNRGFESMLQKQSAEIARIAADTELKKLHRDMFMPAFWAKTALGGIGAVKGLFRPGMKAPLSLNQKMGKSWTPKETPARVTKKTELGRTSPAYRQKATRTVPSRRK